jgi:transketolase
MLADISRGGYILFPCEGIPKVLLLATGSEVHLCMEAAQQLKAQGVAIQVVSLPCWEVFLAQDEAYQEKVLPKSVSARVAIEAGATLGWHRFVGLKGRIIGIDRYGESAPAPALFQYFGLTVENIVSTVENILNKQSSLSLA